MTFVYWGVEFIASFLEISMCCLFCGNFLNEGEERSGIHRVIMVSVFGAGVTLVLNSVSIFSYIHSLLFIVICFVTQLIVQKGKATHKLVLTLIYIVLLLFVDIIVMQLFSLTFQVDGMQLVTKEDEMRIVCIALSKLFLVFIVMVINKITKRSRIMSKKHVVLLALCSLLIFTSNFALTKLSVTIQEERLIIFSIIFLVVTLLLEIVLLYAVFKLTENYEQKQSLIMMEIQNNILQKSQKDMEQAFMLWKKSIHDYKHNIIALRQLLEDGKMDEISQYLENECHILEQKSFLIKTGNSVADAIINTKQKVAEEKKIDFTVNAIITPKCRVNDIDLACILGNLIDNAIEACCDESDAYINLKIIEEKKILIIKIVNTHRKVYLDSRQTTKSDKTFHGIGLESVKGIVKKYDGEYGMVKKGDEVVTTIIFSNE